MPQPYHPKGTAAAAARKGPAEKKEYVLLTGKHFGWDEDGTELAYKIGELVPLTDEQFENFKDKFEDQEAYAARTARSKSATAAAVAAAKEAEKAAAAPPAAGKR